MQSRPGSKTAKHMARRALGALMKELGSFVGRSATWQEGRQEGSAQGSWWGEPGQREGLVGIPDENALRARAASWRRWRQRCGDPHTTSDPGEALGLWTVPRGSPPGHSAEARSRLVVGTYERLCITTRRVMPNGKERWAASQLIDPLVRPALKSRGQLSLSC